MRKFDIQRIELEPGGSGPDRIYNVYYKAIRNKVWVESKLSILARNEKQARDKAILRFGGKE